MVMTGNILREGEGDNGGRTIREKLSDEGTVGWGGEDGDGDTAAEEEVG